MFRSAYKHTCFVRLIYFLLAWSSLLTLSGKAFAQGLDNPISLKPGATFKVDLFDNEETHIRISLPAGQFKIFLDARRADGKVGNMMARLSILNSDGVVSKKNAISLNTIDKAYREVYALPLKSPTTQILHLSNGGFRQTFWLTVLKEPGTALLPFFNEISPKSLALDQSVSGTLDSYEFVYYATKLTRGDYKLTLDFELSANKKTNIQGYLATLDEDGGNQKKLIKFNEIDTFSRKTGPFAVRGDTVAIFRIHCGSHRVNYKLTIQPDTPAQESRAERSR